MAGDSGGVTLLARCRDQEVVRGQITAHYPQARIHEISEEEDPLRLGEGEEAWGMTLSSGGPDYLPLRTFRDDDLLDPGSDPLIALLGALSSLKDGERIVARLLLRSLGPDWSQAHLAKALKRPDVERRDPSYTYTTKPLQTDGVTMAILGVGALAALRGYFWIQDGETWKAILLGAGFLFGAAVAGWGWWRWKRARSRVYDPILIKEKVSRIAFDGQLQVTAFLRQGDTRKRSRELLGSVAAAYRHYDHPAGARFKVSKVRPAVPSASLQPPGPGLFGKRSVLGVREVAALWHPPGARDETPLVERSGARVLLPSARGVRGGAPVGHTTAGTPRDIHFPEDLLRRHHLYVARTRMGKSTLMHHVVAHKMREKAEGRDNDAIVVVDPHTDLVSGLLRHVPESLADQVRLIDLADERGAPGINLLDTRIFADRDPTADSVVRVARGLWDQWGPRMQSILEQTVKTLHEANERMEAEQQYTILDGLRLLSDAKSKDRVLAKVSDPYLLEWWSRDFGQWHRQYKAEALAPVQTLAKLSDLSRTMQDTLLANIGCLCVFQVAGADARTLVWELGKDRVSEDDITSLPVHQCYVRATVGTERMPSFSMMVRKPDAGDSETAARIRAASISYTISSEEIESREAEGRKQVEDFRKGIAALDDEEAPPSAGAAPKDSERNKPRSKRNKAEGGAETNDSGQGAPHEEQGE